ncbi:MAG: hypothetical protein MUD12_15520 [Spirochaetes bacterium]|jgi:hypothetical protein|nr:hypothetical protein [Spirochaetota bacterium]
MKSTVFIIIIAIIVSCSSPKKSRVYKNTAVKNGTSAGQQKSAERIDRGDTAEAFFKLDGKADCIRIEVFSRTPDASPDKMRTLKSYFIVEKMLEISRNKRAFSEIGRNYNADWQVKRRLTICSSETDPIKKLDPAVYRIRFTTFTPDRYDYSIKASADCGIAFRDRP